MYPTVEDVIRFRLIARALLRMIGIVVALFCFWPFSSWIMEGVRARDLLWLSYYAPRIILGLTAIVLGAAFFFGARPIARVLIPMRYENECPACRYPLAGSRAERCPECGLRLPPGFASETDAESIDAARRKTMERAANAPFFSILGTVLIITGAAGLFLGSSWGVMVSNYRDYSYSVMLFTLVVGSGIIAIGALMIARAGQFQRARQRLKEAPTPPLAAQSSTHPSSSTGSQAD